MEKRPGSALRRQSHHAQNQAWRWITRRRCTTLLGFLLFGLLQLTPLVLSPALGSSLTFKQASTSPTCADYFHLLKRRLSYDFNPLLKIRHAILRTGIADNISEGTPLAGRFGGARRVFTKKDPATPWERYFETPGFNDVLVNPDSILRIIGTSHAKKFGFELSPNKVVMPDAKELRNAIQSFNRQFPEGDPRRLHINFYETDNKPLSGDEYRRRFLDGGELPMAKSGRLHFHDFTAHVGATFAPKEIVDETRRRIQVFAGFDDYLKSQDPSLRRLVSDLYKKRTDNLIDTHSNRGQNNLVETSSGIRDFQLPMHAISDNMYAIRARDNVANALTEILNYIQLSPSQAQALSRHVESYMAEQLAKDPSLGELPFGLTSSSRARTESINSVPISLESEEVRRLVTEHTRRLLQERISQLQSDLRSWSP